MLRPDVATPIGQIVRWDRGHLRYLGTTIRVLGPLVVLFLIGAGVMAVLGSAGAIVALIVILAVWPRLFLVFPAAAIGTPMTLRASWTALSPVAIPFGFLAATVLVPAWLVSSLPDALAAWLVAPLPAVLLSHGVVAVVSLVAMAALVAILSAAYTALVEPDSA